MINMETSELLADEQYDSHQHKVAVLQCLNKGLFYDLIRQWRRPVVLCSNNAKSCYDCITLLVAALSLCRLGAPIPAAQSMMKTLHGMNHHIRMMYSDSQQSVGRKTWNALIAGIGQGNGASPSIWAAVSSPMFDIMCQNGFYALMRGPISHKERKIAGFSFVDDTDLCITHNSDGAAQVARHMQESVTHWEGLLQATGGALVLEKGFWYLINFEWKNNMWRYKGINQTPGTLSILDTD